ncbi:MAG TPA: formate dehydrogenase accessory sulfurtransferase FdhD [Saprospiraceae bacterium]|nr:formate dehydrogenase accessory sulfurtransferase FdhD [Saprospiraceae bacterium]HMP25261.1 formate dehydrogenase accessory sulfurtransferase FdhD [Saprospiraceae bacterium]
MLSGTTEQSIIRIQTDLPQPRTDLLAVEEPLEIQLAFGKGTARSRRSLAVTMRTPGHDFDLVMGFLFTEGIIGSAQDVLQMRFAGEQLDENAHENVVLVDLHPALDFDFNRLNRHFYTASSCGVCGKASIEMVQTTCSFLLPKGSPSISTELLFSLPQKLYAQQTLFSQTGGIHAAALFDASGNLQWLREDVGRHNALDKLIGAALKQGQIPLQHSIILVSGRASFELVQKALMAGVPVLAAVGAASSLAAELAEAHGMTLVGFLRAASANIYCGYERIDSLRNR